MAARLHCVFSILTRQYWWTLWNSSCLTASLCRTCHTATNTVLSRHRPRAGSARTQQHTQSDWCRASLADGLRTSECCGYIHALGALRIAYLGEVIVCPPSFTFVKLFAAAARSRVKLSTFVRYGQRRTRQPKTTGRSWCESCTRRNSHVWHTILTASKWNC
jgi:hypothetical protein